MTGETSKSARRPLLYVIALAHLDTQWQWTVRDTARRFLPATVAANELLFERFPSYVLNLEGAYRYRLLADCHPELLEVVRRRVTEGRWFPSGAAWEAFDSNLPSPESLIRQILLGTRELERLVGRASRDLFLPDCFGFSRALPSVAAHCGIVGFSTQKLRRGPLMRSAFGIPFPLGIWRGPDGGELLAALDPGEYGAQTRIDLSRDEEWAERLDDQQRAGLPAALPTYQGLGDRGGAIAAKTAALLEKARSGDGPLEVRLVTSEQLFTDLADERHRFPRYDGELLLRLHATGCYSSRVQLKRWHAAAELLAQTSERATALAAPFLSAEELVASAARLRRAWERILAHQMHDDLTGTSLPEAYRFGAHDLALSINELDREMEFAVGRIGSGLAAPGAGTQLLIYNPLGDARDEIVALRWPIDAESESPPRIFAADESPVAAQWKRQGALWHGWMRTAAAPLSVSRFSVGRGAREHAGAGSVGEVDALLLENARYRARIDSRGDLASLFDQRDGAELLAGPVRIELLDNFSDRFPSWEIRWEDTSRPPRSWLDSPCTPRRVEDGPLRSTIEVEQSAAGSRFRRRYSLAAGEGGNYLEIELDVDWRSDATLAKVAFPFGWEFDDAVYDLGIGAARRPVAAPELYEVPAQSWVAAPRSAGGGAVVFSDGHCGWDHPDPHRLRLTLLHTPRTGRRFPYQRRQDFGAHRFRFAIGGYGAGEPASKLASMAERFRQPMRAFSAARSGEGPASVWSPFRVQESSVRVQAVKPAEDGEGLIVRWRETDGRNAVSALEVSEPFAFVAPVDGCERALNPTAPERKQELEQELTPHALRAWRLRAASLPGVVSAEHGTPVALERTVRVVSPLGEEASDGGLDGRGCRLPAHLTPLALPGFGLVHDLTALHREGACRARGQTISTPVGAVRLALLLAAFGKPVEGSFRSSTEESVFTIPDGFAPAGRFDELVRGIPLFRRERVAAGYFERLPVLYEIPHRLDRRGRIDPCRPILLFELELALASDGDRVALPDNPSLLLFAATSSSRPASTAHSVSPLFEQPRFDRSS